MTTRKSGFQSERTSPVGNPTRRELLRMGLACGAACGAAGFVFFPARAAGQQDDVGANELEGPRLEGVARHAAMFWEKLDEKKVQCRLCPRECQIADVERGYCGVRENQGGEYQTLVYGALCSANVDPIEKKPLFHYLPGTTAFSVATAGCNVECKFCQNWEISQFRPEQVKSVSITPERLAETCKQRECPTIAYTYSEPTIFYEYMHDAAKAGRAAGVGSVMISNGYMQEKPLRQLCEQLTGVKIDLKAFTEKFYAEWCAGRLEPVKQTLLTLKKIGIWFEVVVLIIPTLNDSAGEIEEMSKWTAGELGPDVPLHFTRFHPTYRVTNLPSTPVGTLERCRDIARKAGVHYVYAGNVPMHEGENTRCHGCGEELIRRVGFRVVANRIEGEKCAKCGAAIPGVWTREGALGFRPRT
jgi:pyruvate formate lyase activating enzyme